MGDNNNKYCGQTVTPVVDETLSKCDEFIFSECVIYEDSIPFLGITPNSNMNSVIDAIVNKLKDSHLDYNNLVTMIAGLSESTNSSIEDITNIISNIEQGEIVIRENYRYKDINSEYTVTSGDIILPLHNTPIKQILLVIVNGTILSLEYYEVNGSFLHIRGVDELIKEEFPISVIYKY